MNKIKAIFSDFDGSLLNENKLIGEKDLETIKKLKQNGIHFIGATGRHFPIARKYSKDIGTELPFILCNGGLIYDYAREEPIKYKYIDKALVRQLVKFAEENNLNCYAYTSKGVYIRGDNPDKAFYERVKNIEHTVRAGELIEAKVSDFTLEDKDVLKFLYSNCPQEKYDELMKTDIGESGLVEIAYSGENFLDVNMKGANKGVALEYICQMLNINPMETIAMGDNFNDIEMLKVAGIAVCPQNAKDEVKKYADVVTVSCNENPLTRAIETINEKYGKIVLI